MLVYCATFPNGKKYIGITKNSLKRRISSHKHKALKKNAGYIFHSAIRKYGFNSLKWEILYKASSIDDLKQKEISYIKEYNTLTPNGYNVGHGGEGAFGITAWNKGKSFSEKTKLNMSISRKDQYKKTVLVNCETRTYKIYNSISQLAKENNFNYGSVKMARKRDINFFHYKVIPFELFNASTENYKLLTVEEFKLIYGNN